MTKSPISSDDFDAAMEAMGMAKDPIRTAFVAAIRDRHMLRQTADETIKRLAEEMEPVGLQIIEMMVDRLLRAACILTMNLELPEARAVMGAVDLILDIANDADMSDRMAKRQESYERTLLEMERDVKHLDPEQIHALRTLTKSVIAAERAKGAV